MAATGIEVASAYISLLVKAPGLGKEINRAVAGVDTSAAGKRIGKQISDSVGASLKNQVAKKFAEATATAFEKQTTAAKKLADAEHALVKARAQHGTTSAKVTVAEEKLLKLRASGKATTGQLEAAEAALAKAQADAAGTSKNVVSAQNSLTEAKRNATDASKAYTAAVEAEASKGARALEWMPLASARIDEIAGKWQSAGAKISGVGDSLTNNITKPAAAAGGAVLTLVGALGFKRLVGIDTARGQFKGLGMDADAVMKQVDAGVTNTSLSMATGASLAVGILATGAVPLGELEAQIKRVANVSAAYNVESEHAGYLLNNVLSKNKVTYGDLSQMVQNQIPIITQLADYYGVAAGDIEDMARRGEISIADFNAVLDQNAGKAAESYAETWKGVTANIMANLSKMGAKFMEPTFNILKEEAAGFLEMLKSDEFSKIAADIGSRVAAAVTTVTEKVRELFDWWASLSEGQKKFIGVSAGVLIALGPVIKILGFLVGGIGKLITATKIVIALFTGWKTAAGGAALSVKALTGATQGQTAALKIAAVAQKGFAGALDLIRGHPIIAAITLIVGLLVWFFTQTELGQAIFAEFTQFLGEAWANISAVFQMLWENVLKPIFDGIGIVVGWLWNNILKPTFDAWAILFAIVGGILAGVWESIIKPIFDGIGAIVGWLWTNIVQPYFGLIGAYFKALGQVISWLWTNIVQPTFNLIGGFISAVWTNWIKPVLTAFWGFIQHTLGPIFNWLYQTVIQPVWNGISALIASVWTNGIKPVIDTLVRVIQSDPKRAFEAARDAIGVAWKGIQDLAKAPVKFVVETVINGLIGTINKIPGVDIPKVSLPKGFARGGILPGMSRMSDGDDQLIMARRGEGMMVSEALRTSADRSAFLAANAAGRRGIGFASMLQGLARGGLVHPMPGAVVTEEYGGYPGHRGIDLALPQGTPIRAAASGTVDFSGWYGGGGWMAGLNHGRGLGTRYKHMMSPPIVAVGQKVKQRQIIGYEGTTGDSTGPHLHYEVLKNGDRINPRPYLDGAGDAGMLDIFEGLKGLLKGQFTKAFPGSDMWIDAAWGIGADGIDRAIKWGKSMLPWGGGTAPLLYDNGGFLDPGTHLVQNKTRRPEPILTGSQWDDIRASRDGGGLRPGDQLVLRVGEEEFDAYVEHKADSRIQRAGRRDAARMRTRQGLN